ncbi:MAG: tetratricopeptide repeat protein [Magnetococcales bacterium]|nr:tetratricopeptide repeat protein [Magnetococcales bacterium]
MNKHQPTNNTQKQLSVKEAFGLALEHFNSQRYPEAAKLCTLILSAVPNNIDVINLLGLIAQKLNRHDLAIKEFERAINIDKNSAGLFFNLAKSQHAQSQTAQAVQSLKSALAIEPENSQVKLFLASLNNISTANSDTKNLHSKAETALKKGVDFHRANQFSQAIQWYKKVLELKPDDVPTLTNIGTALQSMGQLDEAYDIYQKAIKIKPDFAMAYNNLGNILNKQGRQVDAIASYNKAIKIKANYSLAYFNLANALKEQGELDKAVTNYQKAIDLQPDYAEAYNNIGNVLKELKRVDDAIASYNKALEIKPDYAEAQNNIATAQHENGQFQQCIANYQKAIAIQPNYAEAYNNLGNAIKEQGKLAEAVSCYKKAITIKPGFVEAHNNLIFCTDLITGVDSDLFQTERQVWAKQHAIPLQQFWPELKNSPNPTKKLRIGYVSSDFRHHSAAYIFGPVLLHHDRDNFSITCYAGNRIEDDMTKQFKQVASKWLYTDSLNDVQLADEIVKDGIDILVDLAGHTKGSRLLTFARKPAPIQITAWGYPHGTGMAAMDYLFADPIFIPPSQRHKYVEEIIDLPCAVHLNSTTSFTNVKELPYNSAGYITFGAFNRIEKYSDEVYRVWAQILHKIPTAKIFIKTVKLDNAKWVEKIHNRFSQLGIQKSRVTLKGKTSKEEHQESYNSVDITLDPFPHNGGMTTLESLRMGVPVLTCENLTRCPTSASILHVVGLDEWRANGEEEYIEKAVEFANNIHELNSLRHELRDRFDKSVLWDSKLYTKSVENIYRKLWKNWCRQKTPE